MYTIRESVASKLADAGPVVESIVIDKLVQVEVDSRVDTIMRGLDLREKLEKSLKKIDKPDVVTYLNGEKVEVMSEGRFKEITALNEKIEKLDKLISDSLEKNNGEIYGKLNDFIKSNSTESSGGGKSSTS